MPDDKPALLSAKAEHDSLPLFDGSTPDLERLLRAIDHYKDINQLSEGVASTSLMAKLTGAAYTSAYNFQSFAYPGKVPPYDKLKSHLRTEFGVDKDMLNPVSGAGIESLKVREGEHLGDFHRRTFTTLFDVKTLQFLREKPKVLTLEEVEHLHRYLNCLGTRQFAAGIPASSRPMVSQIDFTEDPQVLFVKLKNISLDTHEVSAMNRKPNANKPGGSQPKKSDKKTPANNRPKGSNFGFKPKKIFCKNASSGVSIPSANADTALRKSRRFPKWTPTRHPASSTTIATST